MGLFGKKKEERFEGMLGVDVGTSGIKVVEIIPEGGRLRLSRYGYSEPAGAVKVEGSLIDDAPKAADTLKRIMKDSGMKATKAVASLPSSKVFHAMITLPVPKSPKEDLKPIIEAQARKLLPLPLEEMILDSNILDKDLLPKQEVDKQKEAAIESGDKSKKYIRVLLTGAPKVLITKYVEMFRIAKIELVSLETEIFAVVRSLVGKDKSRVMIVDMGAERTNIAVVDKGVPYITRGIKSGGNAITQALAESMSVSFEEAEAMKRDLSYSATQGLPAPLEEAVKPILHEIKYTLQLYADQEFHDNSTVEKIIITGGSSHVPGLIPYLTAALNVNVYHGDPWARVATVPEARPVLDEVGPRLAVAIGLSMRNKDEVL
ncbi:MAG: Type pilus assembly protein PilM [Patescibacteria group bacterium]|jgi:type IV pilus assembly protein PilM|nr:Type pilus assembly protein PilM [Patescibacteria group bacterium]